MSNSNNNIKAKVRTDKPNNKWTQTKDNSPAKTKYYYMFTGGYWFDENSNTIGNHTSNDDDGPAGEVEILANQTSFTITVDDSTGKNFKISKWDLSSDGSLSEVFTPSAGTVQDPTVSSLTISVGAEGANQKDKYKGYFVTLVNDDGYEIDLDPRIYEKRT